MVESKLNNFLIDGFPRNQDNLNGWNKQIGEKANVKSVLFLECPDDVITIDVLFRNNLIYSVLLPKVCMKRCLGRGRHDDESETILKRQYRPFLKNFKTII